MDDRRLLNFARRFLAGVDWRLVKSASMTTVSNSFVFSVHNDIWSDERYGPLDANGCPELTPVQRRFLWKAIWQTWQGDPASAELALLRTFLQP